MLTKLTTLLLLALAMSSLEAQVVTIGTGTTLNTQFNYPAPYGNYWFGSRHQLLIQASELLAAGAVPGATLTSVAFDVAEVHGQPLANFEMRAGLTLAGSLNGNWIAGLNQVVAPIPSYAPFVGWNIHGFTTPMAWDGTSNLVIETCHQNTNWSLNCVFRQSMTPFVSSQDYRQDNMTVCTYESTHENLLQRPNMRLGFGAVVPCTPGSGATLCTPATLLMPGFATLILFSAAPMAPIFVFGDTVVANHPLGPNGIWGTSQIAFSSNLVAFADPTNTFGSSAGAPWTSASGEWMLNLEVPYLPFLSGLTLHMEAYVMSFMAPNMFFWQSNLASTTLL